MTIKEKMAQELKNALRVKDESVVLTLRMVFSAILNKEKEKRAKIAKLKPNAPVQELEKESALSDEEILDVFTFEAKKRKEAIVEFKKGARLDLVQKEERELTILEKYLPQQLSYDQMQQLVKETISSSGASGMKDIGKVMGQVGPKTRGRADGAMLAQIVKEILQNG